MDKVCVFTGTRAEYGLLFWTMKRIKDDPKLQLQTLVSGSHMSDYHGATWKEIEKDGFSITKTVSVNLDDDSPLGVARIVSTFIGKFAEALVELKPDVLIILGDRYEAFAAAIAATMLRIPIAHIHGGEITAGASDDSFRHAISKMAHIHFTASETYRKRVIQLGEHPDTVFNVGATGIEVIKNMEFISREELKKDIGFNLEGKIFLITYHPETLSEKAPSVCIEELLDAMSYFPNVKLIFTQANADIKGQIINKRISQFVSRSPDNACIKASLGQLRYLSLMAISDVIIGNSSSGIIEAPAMGVPTVNVGDRQKGRVRTDSIIDCEISSAAVKDAIKLALSDEMKETALKRKQSYKNLDTSKNILKVLKGSSFRMKKMFYDLDFKMPLNTAV